MPQAGYGPVKRMLFDSVLTLPLSVFSLRNISGGRDVGQIRWNTPDSSLYMYSGSQWIKINTDTSQLSNRIANKLSITDTSSMLSSYLRKVDTASLSNRIDLRVKYTDTASMFSAYHTAIKARIKYTDSASMLAPYLRKLDTLSLSNRINKKQDTLTLTTSGTSGPSTLTGSTLNIPNYGTEILNYVPYVGASNDVDLGTRDLTADFLFAKGSLKVQDNITATGGTDNYTSIQTKNTEFVFFSQKNVSSLTYKNVARFLYATPNVNFNNEYSYNLPVRNGTLALVEDTVSLSNRINAISISDTTSLSNRINLKLNISDTASMLTPYLRKADTSSLSNRINLRVKYSDTAAMLSPYLKSAVTSVGLSMPSAFTVTNSPVTSTGTLTVTGAGNASQYVDGTGALQTMQGIVTEVETLVKEVYNNTGATLTKGTVVYINGGHGNLPTVTKAAASSDALSAQTFGVVRTDISTNSNGYVIVVGDLNDMPTNAYANGTQLYLSTTAGQFTSTKQYAPSHLVYVGIVTRSHPTQGVISVKIQNGYEMDELHNVSAQSPNNNSLLQYKTATSLWTKVDGTTSNIAEGTNLYYTEARVDANTNVAANTAVRHDPLTIGTANGLNLFSQVLSLNTASTTNTGALTSADWNTFNGKGTVSSVATGLGLSGGPITSFGTLSVDTSSASILSRQRAAATYQAAGTYVTSVTGTSPIVSSGGTTPAISIPAATSSVNGYLSSTDWSTFNGKMNYSDTTSLSNRINTKGSGTVTSIATGLGLSGGTITTSGTLLIDTASASILSRQRAANTYATTSLLSGYLPLTGGTLTGALGGTSATFSSNVQISGVGNSLAFATLGVPASNIISTVEDFKLSLFCSRGTSTEIKVGSSSLEFLTSTTPRLTIASTGDATFSKNLVIGTGAASNRLTLYGANEVTRIRVAGGTGYGDSYMQSASGSTDFLSDSKITFYPGFALAMTLTSGGNVGIGNTPSGWGSIWKPLQLGSYGGYITGRTDNNSLFIGSNNYHNGSSFIYTTTGPATNMYFGDAGEIVFRNAASGTAGASFSFDERMRISGTGVVTITNLGTGSVTASSGVLSIVSDSSYKIADGFIEDALPSVMNLKPRYFYWKDKSGLDTTIRQLGFYAQEVNSAIGEEAANTPKGNTTWGITDRSLIAYLTKAIQEQQLQIKELQTEIQTLKNK